MFTILQRRTIVPSSAEAAPTAPSDQAWKPGLLSKRYEYLCETDDHNFNQSIINGTNSDCLISMPSNNFMLSKY
jgi:hypothetical protein